MLLGLQEALDGGGLLRPLEDFAVAEDDEAVDEAVGQHLARGLEFVEEELGDGARVRPSIVMDEEAKQYLLPGKLLRHSSTPSATSRSSSWFQNQKFTPSRWGSRGEKSLTPSSSR